MKTYCVAIFDYYDEVPKIHVEFIKAMTPEGALKQSRGCKDIRFPMLVLAAMIKTLDRKHILATVTEVPICMD